ncbi:hypothetical protein O999_11020 [Pseudomonas putida LF54]|nr:hypothetical protein O999_11020 [Pseudomonas putida LF54]
MLGGCIVLQGVILVKVDDLFSAIAGVGTKVARMA